MAKIICFLLLSLLLVITSAPPIASRSTVRSDLIDGNEFLSLFINQESKNKENSYDDLEESRSSSADNDRDLNHRIEVVDSLLTNDDELLTQDATNYGMHFRDQFRNQNYPSQKSVDNQSKNLKTITTPSYSSEGFPNNKDKKELNDENNHKQVVKFVTSGSKIVFLEEITPALSNGSNKSSSNSQLVPGYDRQLQDDGGTISNVTESEEIQVISIRVSSTVAKARSQGISRAANSKPDDLDSFTPAEQIQGNDNLFDDNNNNSNGDNKNDFINRSHKSDFSIEESEPVTQESISDSVNGESTNIHSIVAPPSSINQSPHHMTAGAAAVTAGRMQRKQDKLVPFQTVIYHDTSYNKDGSAQPRSVSYSSLAQSIDDLGTWKDLDSFLEAKKNVSEGLKPLHSETVKGFSQPEKVYSEPAKFYSEPAKMYGEPSKFYSEPAKVYSEPAKIYGQPEKQYSQPAKVYSEPARVYSEPAKTYSEPAKVYGEPSKVYWPPPLTTTPHPKVHESSILPTLTTKPTRRVIFNLDKLPYDLLNAPESSKRLLEPDLSVGRRSRPPQESIHKSQQHQQNKSEQPNKSLHGVTSNLNREGGTSPTGERFSSNHRDLVTENPNYAALSSAVTRSSQEIYKPTPEQNYEIEESVSVMTNGRAHGIQPPIVPPTASPTDDSKVGYVVEGRNYRKYRVEEKTPDGFIVGEYGVVSHNDDSIRGVRYTADSNINPSLIHEALMKFLSL